MNEDLFKDMDALLAEEARRMNGELLQDGDITIRRLRERYKLSKNQAWRMVEKVLAPRVEAGEYLRLMCRNPNGGGRMIAWRRVVNGQTDQHA